ncbi:MAG TPA: MerR family transcriptional regulator [Puia sp.]|nr:MerR family transcriptional regulator [Puia sp.]
MNVFTIRDIENLCGIKAHTLRIWEQRYGLVRPKRKAGNHRMYDNEDLRYLLRIAYLYHYGYKISGIAELSEAEICRLTLDISTNSEATGIYVNQLLEASMDFNQEQFDRILHNIILHYGVEKSFTRVIFPFLQKIGLLWLTGHLIPAQEHFASTFIMKKLQVAINGLECAPLPGEKRVLLFTPKGELHEIPLLFMQYMLKKNKIPTVYFGCNIDLEELTYYCSYQPVSHLYFHLISKLIRCEPDKYISTLASRFPDKQIVASGLQAEVVRDSHPNLRILSGMEELMAFACGK